MPRSGGCEKWGFPYLPYLLNDGSQAASEGVNIVLINRKNGWGHLMTLEMFLVYINQSCVKTDVGKPSCWNTLSSNLPKLQRDAIHLRTHPSQVEILEFCIPVSGSGTWFHTVLYLDIILNITATKLAIFNSRIWRVPAFMCTFFSDAYPDAFLQWYYGRLKPCSSLTTHNEDDITTKLSFAQADKWRRLNWVLKKQMLVFMFGLKK